jgi:hypothetical protein
LLVAALAAKDAETALAHGWAAFQETSPASPDDRAEMLLNLGEIGRQSGEHRAALGACVAAIELTDAPRVRLPALGCAAICAAYLGEMNLLAFIVGDVDRTIPRSGQPFENARVLVSLAEAYVHLDAALALQFAASADVLSLEGGFHQVAARVADVRAALQRPGSGTSMTVPRGRRWSAGSRAVLESLERLPSDTSLVDRVCASAG